MARMIDVDKLLNAVNGAIDVMDAHGMNTISATSLKAIIKCAPTIDAIPIDWLVQMRDLRRAAVAAHPDISEGSMAVLRGINVVLELWEDEKEER